MLSCAAAQNRKHREGKGQACLMQSCCPAAPSSQLAPTARMREPPKRLLGLWHILLQREWILSSKPSPGLIYSLGSSEIHSFWEQFDFWAREREREGPYCRICTGLGYFWFKTRSAVLEKQRDHKPSHACQAQTWRSSKCNLITAKLIVEMTFLKQTDFKKKLFYSSTCLVVFFFSPLNVQYYTCLTTLRKWNNNTLEKLDLSKSGKAEFMN